MIWSYWSSSILPQNFEVSLKEGMPCPVCEQEVRRVPKAKRHPSTEKARRDVKAYEKQVNDFLRATASLEGELLQTEPQLSGKRQRNYRD